MAHTGVSQRRPLILLELCAGALAGLTTVGATLHMNGSATPHLIALAGAAVLLLYGAFGPASAIALLAIGQIEWFETSGDRSLTISLAAMAATTIFHRARSASIAIGIVVGAAIQIFAPETAETLPLTAAPAAILFLTIIVADSKERARFFRSHTTTCAGLCIALYLLGVSVHTAHYQTLSGNEHNQHAQIALLIGSAICWALIALRDISFRGDRSITALPMLTILLLCGAWIIGAPPGFTIEPSPSLLFSSLLPLLAMTFLPLQLDYPVSPPRVWILLFMIFLGWTGYSTFAVHAGFRPTTPIDETVSRELATTVLTVEDILFFRHHGIDLARVHSELRQISKGAKLARGGSTIPMQLAKMRYLDYAPTVGRKAVQFGIALWLDATMSKAEILREYLHRLDFGQGDIGIAAASQRHFQRDESRLSHRERAALVFSIRDPYTFAAASLASDPSKRRMLDGIVARSKAISSAFRSDFEQMSWVTR